MPQLFHTYATLESMGISHRVPDYDNEDVREWFDEHPRWKQHFTPKHASWLNQIECVFSVLQRRVLARGSFTPIKDLRDKIYDYLLWHNERAKPST